ncbi:MarR family winged helix-turn-helix transcriptional regulator [Nocardia sp. BMG51109]|uniref:MarR family winged helix-turn-helix transcriptional regulator n=1 Tax=Nocardia sp. BMG51109 TaxID=1056816 RepID=UPI00046638C4|nr:MarR family transcriptional regulator [Nocardia sp. BMG51109]
MQSSPTTQSTGREELLVDIVVAASRLTRLAGSFGGNELPRAMVRALSVLDERGPLRVSEFARIDGCSQPSATALIGRLIAAGLAGRTTDPGDSRVVVVEPTPAGRTRLAASRRAIGTALSQRLPDLDIDRLAPLSDELNELLEALKSAAHREDSIQER